MMKRAYDSTRSFEENIKQELVIWQKAMKKKPSLLNRSAKRLQTRMNRILPERFHQAMTIIFKNFTRAILFGSEFTTKPIRGIDSLEKKEMMVRKRIRLYRTAAAAEGGLTGFGGLIWGLADLPLWLSFKMKMLFEIANIYGFDITDYRERIYILHIFQLTFSSQEHRNKIYEVMANWETQKKTLPTALSIYDWRVYWEEYRDHLDLAKFFQLIPGFGAVVGTYVNHRLTEKLGIFAMNSYRMRLI